MSLLETTLIYQSYIMLSLLLIFSCLRITKNITKITIPGNLIFYVLCICSITFLINLSLFLIIDCKILSLIKTEAIDILSVSIVIFLSSFIFFKGFKV